MERRGNAYGVEGLDGTGKTTVTKLVAEQTESRYFYWTENNSLRQWRKYFDNAQTNLRFLFYTVVSVDSYLRVENYRKTSDVFLDRTVASTIAYHLAFGLNRGMLAFIPQCTLDQLNKLIYLTASDDVRRERMKNRGVNSFQEMTEADKKSLVFGAKVDAEFRKIIPERTLVIETDNRTRQEVADHMKKLLYAR